MNKNFIFFVNVSYFVVEMLYCVGIIQLFIYRMDDTPRTVLRKKRISYFNNHDNHEINQIPSHSPDSLVELDLKTYRPR